MAFVKTEAIVLSKMRYGETSAILTLFTRDFGKFGVIAKGARSAKSSYSGVFEVMNRISIQFNKKDNRELQFISKAECLNTYPILKTNLDKILIAYRIIELINKFVFPYDKYENIFDLTFSVFNYLNESNRNFIAALLYFQILFSDYLGIGNNEDDASSELNKNYLLKDETFAYFSSFKLSDAEFNLLTNMKVYGFDFLDKHKFNEKIINKLIESYDYHFSSGFQGSNIFKTKKSFYQFKN